MAAFSVELCRERLELWLAAEAAVATGQEYVIGTRRLTRADLEQIRGELEYWSGKLAQAEAEAKGGRRNRVYQIIPRDI